LGVGGHFRTPQVKKRKPKRGGGGGGGFIATLKFEEGKWGEGPL